MNEEKWTEIQEADLLRSLLSFEKGFESNNYTIDELCSQIDELIAIAEGFSNYEQFIAVTKLERVYHS